MKDPDIGNRPVATRSGPPGDNLPVVTGSDAVGAGGTHAAVAGTSFPFPAVVGYADAKLAVPLLCAVDPRIGGVLLRGDKGTAKSTLARGLAALLPHVPFIELPLGATEDRVVGSVDVGAALDGDGWRVQPGLLAQADEGVLYVDEVNLLAGHLVDVLLDAAASGVGRVERDGFSDAYPARFVLVGSMNPEEGELRPQLLDRFGLVVDLGGHTSPTVRASAVTRRLAFDLDAGSFAAAWADEVTSLHEALARAADATATLTDDLVHLASALCTELGVETLRADLTLCRAATAMARLEGAPVVTAAHLERVAPLALVHRRRQGPFDRSALDPDQLADALTRARGARPDDDATHGDETRRAGVDGRDGDGADSPTDPAEESAPTGPADRGYRTDPSGRTDRHGGEANGRPAHDDTTDGSATTQDSSPGAAGTDPDEHGAGPSGCDAAPTDDSGQSGTGRGDREPSTTGSSETGPDGTRPDDAEPAGHTLAGVLAPLRLDGPRTSGAVEAPSWVLAGHSARTSTAPSGPPTSQAGGRTIGSRPPRNGRPPESLAAAPTVTAAVRRRAGAPDGPALASVDLREPVRDATPTRVIVIGLDTSASMGAADRIDATLDAILRLLLDAYQRRERVALVAIGGEAAHVVMQPTASVEVARARLARLGAGGATPLASGIEVASAVAAQARRDGFDPLVVLITDGRATVGPAGTAPFAAALEAAAGLSALALPTVVLDAETGPTRLGLAERLAERAGGPHLLVDRLDGATVQDAIRGQLSRLAAR